MSASTEWQLARTSAERYQTILTPAILGPFARELVDVATLRKGESVLDVGCGTGAAARYAAEVVGSWGRVVGVDVNASMIEVARSLPAVNGAPMEWRVASADLLPVDDRSIDGVLCAQTLQFLPDKQAALWEMRRVLKPGGRAALSLWCDIKDNPYFFCLTETIARHIGLQTAAGLRAAFALSAADEIHTLLKEAGFTQIEMVVRRVDLQLPNLMEFVPRHISATPMADGFDRASETLKVTIVREVAERLSPYQLNGRAHIPFRSHLIIARS